MTTITLLPMETQLIAPVRSKRLGDLVTVVLDERPTRDRDGARPHARAIAQATLDVRHAGEARLVSFDAGLPGDHDLRRRLLDACATQAERLGRRLSLARTTPV